MHLNFSRWTILHCYKLISLDHFIIHVNYKIANLRLPFCNKKSIRYKDDAYFQYLVDRMDELLGESLGGLLRSSPRDGCWGGIFTDHSMWDDEADREVAAVSWKHFENVERNRKLEKKNRKNISEVSKKLSLSAPILTMPDEPVKIDDSPPVLYSCFACPFLCTDGHFLTAHRAIEHDMTISNTEMFPDDLVGKKVDAKIIDLANEFKGK